MFLTMIVGAVYCAVALVSIVVLIPVVNSALSFIWEDPSVRQRRKILARLMEKHVDGMVPAETAVLMVAKELNTTEDQLLAAAGLFSASEIKNVVLGQRSLFSVLFNKLGKHLTSTRRKPK